MKKIILLALIPFLCQASQQAVVTIIVPHSQSLDACRVIAGWQDLVNVQTVHENYWVFGITPELTLSYRPERIAGSLFGDSIMECKNTFTIAGSERNNRAVDAWLADYFGLPTDFESAVRVNPQMSNFILDMDAYIGLDGCIPGLYVWLDVPLVYTRWNLQMHECFIMTNSNSYAPGYFNAQGIPHENLLGNFTQFIGGGHAPQADDLTFQPLSFAKMSCASLELFKLSDIQIALGWNVFHNPCYHLGGNIRAVIPAGNTPTGEFLFEPLIGNGHHWELGGGLSTHIIVWQDDKTKEKAGIYCDVNITHLFASNQTRTFDLCGKPSSRYMLATRMGTPITHSLRGIVDGSPVKPIVQYQSEVSSVANLTTLPIQVSCHVQADLQLSLIYTKAKNSWLFGYGFWGRSCDDITPCSSTPFDSQSWALKGDAYMFGFENSITRTPVALSATESEATINAGTNFPHSGASTPELLAAGMQNPHIDNPALATGDGLTLVDQPGGSTQINTSVEPILLTTQDISIDSARTRGISNRIFAHMNHSFTGRSITPYVGVGAEIEFGQRGQCSKNMNNQRVSCFNTAFSFWGIWLKGGVAF